MFDDPAQASAILGTIMGRYSAILREVEAGAFGPLFWETQDGTVIAADWAEGFMQAVALRADAWEPLMRSKRHGRLLFPILALCADEHGDSALGLEPDEEDRFMAEAAEFIPVCVTDTGSGRWTRIEDSWVVELRVGWCAMSRGGEPWRGLLII